MEFDILAWLTFLGAVVVVGLTAAAEIAMTAASRSEIRRRAEQGDRRAAMVDELLADSAQFWLTAMLVKSAGLVVAGIAVAHVLASATSSFWLVFVTLLAWLALAGVQTVARGLVLARIEPVALRMAPFMRLLTLVLWPVTALLYNAGLRASGENADGNDESIFMSEDGLRLLMHVNEEESNIQESEKEMIANILEMDDTVAREVMVPRIDMVTLPVETLLQDALELIIEAGHSRIPVHEGPVDVVVGLLYAKDLLQCFRDNRPNASVRELLRPAYFVPASKKVNDLLREMQQQRIHLAMVVDEYGGIAGLVTIEDIMEEIFGEIQDEYDVGEPEPYLALNDQAFLLNSRLDVYTLAELLAIDLTEEDADTLGGLIYSRLGHVPAQGETFEIEGWRFTVLSLEGRRINQVRADRIAPPAETQSAPASAHASAPNTKPLLNSSSLANS